MNKKIFLFILLFSSHLGFGESSTVQADKDTVAEQQIKKLEFHLADLIE